MATQNVISSSYEQLPPSFESLLQGSAGTLPNVRQSKRVVLNVGGIRHEVMWKALDRLPHTRLGKLRHCTTHEALMELCDDYNLAEMEFFFDRQSRSFSSILNFYQTGRLHLADDVCILSFKEDLDYWKIEEACLETCCQNKYQDRKDHIFGEMSKDAKSRVEDFGTSSCAKWRQKLWDLLERPETSTVALLFTILSIVIVIVSTVSFMLDTLPLFQTYRLVSSENNTLGTFIEYDGDEYVHTENDILFVIETTCVVWFTIECILRFWSCPRKLVFIRNPINIIDVMANISYYILLMVPMSYIYNAQPFKHLVIILQILRIVRLVKLGRCSTAFRSLGYALVRSWKALGLLVMLLIIEVVVFSSLVYFAEKDGVNTTFSSIPDALWWAAVTMTTVGYGDQLPVTMRGKLVGVACCIIGVLLLVLPIPILVYNFTECYGEETRRVKILKRREAHDLVKRSGEGLSLNVVKAQDVSASQTGRGKDTAVVQIGSSPLFQAIHRIQEQEQARF